MVKVILTIEVEGHCSYVADHGVAEHLTEMLETIERYAKDQPEEYRKINVDWEEQEAVDIYLTTKIEEV